MDIGDQICNIVCPAGLCIPGSKINLLVLTRPKSGLISEIMVVLSLSSPQFVYFLMIHLSGSRNAVSHQLDIILETFERPLVVVVLAIDLFHEIRMLAEGLVN